MDGATYKSTFLISNLHCPSCVATIDGILRHLNPPPTKWSSSVVSQQVDVEHSRGLEVQRIIEALVDSGFEIDSVSSTAPDVPRRKQSGVPEESSSLSRSFTPIKRWLSTRSYHRLANEQVSHRHDEYCDACGAHDSGDEDEGVEVESPKPEVKRARLAVSGMSCSSCVNSITSTLKDMPWVKLVNVNLVGNSASIDFEPPGTVEEIVQTIEDLGYDATIDSVIDLAAPVKKEKTQRRTVQLEIDGFHCSRCPLQVMEGLETFGDKVQVKSKPTLENPVLELSYIPEAPQFTIRHIITALLKVDQKFHVSIYHPPSLEEQSRLLFHHHMKSIARRLVLTAVIAVPTFIIGIVLMTLVPETNEAREYFMQPFSHWTGNASRFEVSLFILATPVYLFAADMFHKRALREIWIMWKPGSKTPYLHRFFRFGSMDMLTSLGTTIAYVASLVVMIIEAAKPSTTEPMGAGDSYFDAVVFLTLFLLMGRLLELYSKSKAGDAVAELGKLRPTTAFLVETSSSNGQTNENQTRTRKIAVDLLEVGDILRVPSGTSPPCDGTIIDGETKFDEASLTGESRLITKKVEDQVFSGTINQGSPILIRATGVAGSSMLDQIVSAVRDGQTNRAPIERFADVITSFFVPIVTLLAIVTWLVWLTLGLSGTLPADYLDISTGGWPFWSLQFAIAVFVVACPCGVGLAAPTALFVGGGLAARNGILVKGGGEAFQEASNLDCIVFDKTGTLTTGGEPAITDSEVFPNQKAGLDEQFILSALRSLEEASSHPIARAIVSFCDKKNATSFTLKRTDEISGKGMSGVISNEALKSDYEILLGNEPLLNDFHVPILTNVHSTLDKWKNQAKSVAILAMREKTNPTPGPWTIRAILAASDPVRPEAPGVIQSLQKRNIQVFMLSGDNQITANAVGKSLGIPASNIIAGALPGQKADKIRALQQSLTQLRSQSFFSRLSSSSPKLPDAESQAKRVVVAMVGDGINDSPALTAADVGIAIGSGSDIAISAAKFVLVSPKLTTVLTLIDLSRVVFRRVKLNFAWALIYNILAVPVAGGAFYWLKSNGTHIRLDPVWASLAMAMSSFSVILSSLALRIKLPYIGFRREEEH
jgi:Cu+-exporting ATPase